MKNRIGKLRGKIDELFLVGESGSHVIPGPFRILICVILCLTTAALIECAAFQFPAVWFDSETETFFGSDGEKINYHSEESLAELSAEEINSIIVERNNQKLMAEYLGKPYEEEKDDTLVETEDGKFYRKVQLIIMDVRLSEKKYIGQFDLRIAETAGAQSGYSLFFYENGEQTGDTLFCSIDSRIRAGVTRVGRSADRVRIELMTTEDLKPENIQFTLSNDFSPNPIRVLWITVLLVMGMMLIECRNVLSERPQWGFAYVCFTVGCLLILGIGTNQVSYDEHVHAKAAYKLSFGSQIETTETAMQMGGNLLPVFHNRQERELVEAYEQLNHDYSWADIGFQSRWVRSENRVYYPIAAGFFVGRVLGLSFANTVALAKLGNLLVYVLVCFFAISFAKAYRELVMMIALLPNHVFLASAISYDMVVNAFLLLGVVLLYHELLEPDGPLEWKNLLIMLLSFAFGCQSKPIYILMACMVIFYGSKKFDSRWKEVVCKLSVLIVAGLMLYNIFRPTPVAGSDYHLVSNITYAGDKRNVGSSVLGQIQWIFANPLSYTILLLSQMRDMLFSYLFG
ncbi:MAG: DUF2142 domain-containing protein, partial [Lachnospiraceae bacterium]|nr:DUF2142 domain-containing protein [Lachnospiraceae bacterium]